MKKQSFETQDEKRMYERGRNDALDELFEKIYFQLLERNAFPDMNPDAFIEWANEMLVPELNKFRGQDNLFDVLKEI